MISKGWINRLPEVWGNFTSSVQYWKNWNTSYCACAMCYSCAATQLILFFITSGTLKSVHPSTSTPAVFFFFQAPFWHKYHRDVKQKVLSDRKPPISEKYKSKTDKTVTASWVAPSWLRIQLWTRVVGSVFFIIKGRAFDRHEADPCIHITFLFKYPCP